MLQVCRLYAVQATPALRPRNFLAPEPRNLPTVLCAHELGVAESLRVCAATTGKIQGCIRAAVDHAAPTPAPVLDSPASFPPETAPFAQLHATGRGADTCCTLATPQRDRHRPCVEWSKVLGTSIAARRLVRRASSLKGRLRCTKAAAVTLMGSGPATRCLGVRTLETRLRGRRYLPRSSW